MAHAGSVATRLLADRVGLASELSKALTKPSFSPRHTNLSQVRAVRRLLEYFFTTMHQRSPAHLVFAICDVRNVRSAKLLQCVGMRREDRHLQGAWYGREWTSEYSYALLRREWVDQQTAHSQPGRLCAPTPPARSTHR